MVSNKHLRIYCIEFEDDKRPKIDPMFYAENLSRNGTTLRRNRDFSDIGVGLLTREISRQDDPVLLFHGDELQVSPTASFRFEVTLPREIANSAKDSVQNREIKVPKIIRVKSCGLIL